GAKVDAAPHAHIFDLVSQLLHVGETALDLGIHYVDDHHWRRWVGAQHHLEDAHGHAGNDGSLRGIFGIHGIGVERHPASVAVGGVVAVLVTVADRRHGPPKVVGKLGVPIDDEGVGDAHVE